ncbi:predicted protein [Histoplasma capsulatum G186AR]|uniref:Uncharacterized protein n=1 Tax=Ajellomyces capsulatus (strain G186AR / H82 / ATCC MYA-2454 / RMSCC 2432) TaxID=447093 RepID=C0NBA4_AJECG|nr:uncharacterized protein HCBG_00400 [Histoplasma capsulatum G186AR]EEH10945.1 predicted protein [Histoplasma capsulatum G186AR]
MSFQEGHQQPTTNAWGSRHGVTGQGETRSNRADGQRGVTGYSMHEAGGGESGQSEPRKQKTERRAGCVSSHFMSQPASMTEPLVCAPSTGPASHHPHHVSQNLAGLLQNGWARLLLVLSPPQPAHKSLLVRVKPLA